MKISASAVFGILFTHTAMFIYSSYLFRTFLVLRYCGVAVLRLPPFNPLLIKEGRGWSSTRQNSITAAQK
jgi:hypothetical protein